VTSCSLVLVPPIPHWSSLQTSPISLFRRNHGNSSNAKALRNFPSTIMESVHHTLMIYFSSISLPQKFRQPSFRLHATFQWQDSIALFAWAVLPGTLIVFVMKIQLILAKFISVPLQDVLRVGDEDTVVLIRWRSISGRNMGIWGMWRELDSGNGMAPSHSAQYWFPIFL